MKKADLTDCQRQVLHWRYSEGLTLDQTGKQLGVSRQNVHELEGKALARLRMVVGIEDTQVSQLTSTDQSNDEAMGFGAGGRVLPAFT